MIRTFMLGIFARVFLTGLPFAIAIGVVAGLYSPAMTESALAGTTLVHKPTTTTTQQNIAAVTITDPPITTDPSLSVSTTTADTGGDPENVLLAYYDAINSHDYQTAWELGGKNLGQSYGDYVRGFASTAADMVTILQVRGSVVTIELLAIKADASESKYRATYKIENGQITEGHARHI